MTENAELDYYQILKVERDATPQQIRAAFRKRAGEFHPDRAGDSEDARKMSALVGKAAGVLMKEDSRAEYDRELHDKENPPQEAPAPEPSFDFDEDFADDQTFQAQNTQPAPEQRFTRPGTQKTAPNTRTQAPVDYDPFTVDPFSLVDTNRMSWSSEKFKDAKEHVVHSHPHRQKGMLFSAGFFLSILVALVVHFGTDADFFLKIGPVVPMLIMGYFGHAYITKYMAKVEALMSYVGVIAAYVLCVFVFASGNHPGVELWRALTVSGILGVGAYLMTRGGHFLAVNRYIQSQRPVQLKKKDILEWKVWGKIGQVGDSDFGDRERELGVLGEQNTGQLMAYLLDIPGTRVFHCLQFPVEPGHQPSRADVDHVVINGDKVAIIDSKMWQGRKYTWQHDDHIGYAAGSREFSKKSNFPKAVRLLAADRFAGTQVRAWMTIYSNDGNKVQVDNTNATCVRMVTPHRMIEEIGAWFTEDPESLGTIDKGIVNAAAAQLKLPQQA